MPHLDSYNFLWTPLFEDSPTALVLLNKDGVIEKVNAAAAEIFSGSPIVSKMNFSHCFADLNFEEVIEKTQSSREGYKVPRLTLQHATQSITIEILFKNISIDGHPYILCHLRDISEAELSARFLNFFSFIEKNLNSVSEPKEVYNLCTIFAATHIAGWAKTYMLNNRELNVYCCVPSDSIPDLMFELNEIIKTGTSKLHYPEPYLASPVNSWIAVPIRQNKKIVGVFKMGTKHPSKKLDRIDLMIAEELVTKMSLLIERSEANCRLIEMRDLAYVTNKTKTYCSAHASH